MSELMEATATTESPPKTDFLAELKSFGKALPDKAVLAVLLAAWVLLFQYLGWTTTVAGKTGSLFAWMWGKWDDPANDAGHGKLIPFVVLAILWARRERLVKSVSGVWWPPLLAVGLALALHVAGFVVQQPRLSMVALFFGAWGLVGLVWGWEAWKVTFFPFLIFAFCLPMGGTFAQDLTLPLRKMAAQVTLFVAHDLLQIDVVRSGTELLEAHGRWHYEVAAECSGIRSFVALLAISTIFSVLTMRLFWKRAVMIVLTVPISLVCNVVRLSTIILAATAFKSQAAGAFVDRWFGYVTYMIGIGILLLAARWLREKPCCQPP
jgi:exosortase